ncbi:4345_t:CDS:2 [Ambispora gerdemannii]|uniref:4345_t:CDS:1 n=1 Tax=Ambispora gerdemannii TaxID=144530 RepID=A0A9N9CHL4_9GLOM|nr:4345_t:CDS:2 [Ambispora gerdemannii]
MAERTERELNDAKKELEDAKRALANFEGDVDDEDRGARRQEKARLEDKEKRLGEAKEARLKQVEELQRALIPTTTTQPGNDFDSGVGDIE